MGRKHDGRSSKLTSIGCLLVVTVVAGCTAALQGTTTFPSTSVTSTPPDSAPPATLPPVDPVLEAAVAPFDHASAVAWQQTEARLAKPSPEYIGHANECLAAEGFDPLPPLPADVPDKDDVVWISNWQFPNIDELHASGFASLEVEESMLIEPEEQDPTRNDAIATCVESAERAFADSARSLAIQTFAYLRGEWEQSLTAIDKSEEVEAELDRFSTCLTDAGIPREWAGSTTLFLSYVDEQLWLADDDEQRLGAIRLELGQLYGQCSESMFELALRMRSGPIREEFLQEHASTLHALDRLVDGEIPRGYSVPTSPQTA